MTQLELETHIESLMDAHTAQRVLNAIVSVCQDKAEHVRSNWQDEPLSSEWLRAARAVNRAAIRIP